MGNRSLEEDGELGTNENAPGEMYQRVGACQDRYRRSPDNERYASALKLVFGSDISRATYHFHR